jgi:pimeloyl-ACP methyl ester carboxylesterase
MNSPDRQAPSTDLAQKPLGQGRFFRSQTYHFQALRALTEAPYGGADIGEVLETVKRIHEGDTDSWFQEWEATAARVAAFAAATRDPISKGNAYLRAHNYLRTAEFLLAPADPRRDASWQQSKAHFFHGLEALEVHHTAFSVPYGGGELRCLFYPGPDSRAHKPLIVFVGGFDSTMEELYTMLVRAANDRGYAVLTYEGPGQGDALRTHGLRFEPTWERPTAAVLDTFLERHPWSAPIVLVGMSMGGYFAPRAAAFESRVHGVVAFDTFFDVGETAQRYAALVKDPIASATPDFRWADDNAKWTLGSRDMADTARILSAYTLQPVAHLIRQHVLILAAGEDHFVPLHQTRRFQESLVNARSIRTHVYDRPSGGAEHCQLGAVTLWHAHFFDWLNENFE